MKHNIIAFTLALTLSSAVFADSSPVATTGLFSLSAGQSVQLHLLNLDDKDCNLDVNLLDSSGNLLSGVNGVNKLIKTKNSASLDLPSSTTNGPSPSTAPTSSTIVARVELDFTPQLINESTLDGCGKLIPTLEIIESSKSAVILNTNFYDMPSGDKSGNYKVKICHKTGSSSPKTIEVALSALKSHLSHKDQEGACTNDHDHNDDKGTNKNKD